MTPWTRSVVVPVAVAVPLLGIANDLLSALIAGDPRFPPPWRNPSAGVWALWGLIIPLVLLLEQRWPLRRPSVTAAAAHGACFAAIVGVHLAVALLLGADALARLPRYVALDLVIYALIVAAAYALRSHFQLRERERAAAALEADVRRAEVELVRHNLEPEHIFRELAALRDDILVDSSRAERRLEALSDHLERQLDSVALLAHEAREPLQQLYGTRQSVTIRTVEGAGFAVELHLPARFADA